MAGFLPTTALYLNLTPVSPLTMTFKKNGFLFLFLLAPAVLFGDNLLDSLQGLLKKDIPDTQRVMVYHEIINEVFGADPDKALLYGDTAYAISEKKGYLPGLYRSLQFYGRYNFYKAYYKKAQDYFLKAYRVAEKIDDPMYLARSINSIGAIYATQGYYDRAAESYDKALRIAEQSGDSAAIAMYSGNLGTNYRDLKIDSLALKYLYYSIGIRQRIDKRSGTADNLRALASVYNNIAGIFYSKKDWNKALYYDELALEIRKEQNDNMGIINSLSNISDVYSTMGDYKKAMSLSLEALQLSRKIGMREQMRSLYGDLSGLNAKAGDYRAAYSYDTLQAQLKDSIFGQASAKQIADMTTKYETEQKEKAIKLTTQRNNIQDLSLKKKQWFLYASYTGGVLLLIISGIFLNSYFLKKKTNLELEKQNQEVVLQKNIIEEKNREITSSIYYAKKIQDSILLSEKEIKKQLPGGFILFLPKDIVSGDFYFLETKGSQTVVAAVDCTGHGVPGAFMSLVGHDSLKQALQQGITQPGLILNYLSRNVNISLRQASEGSAIKDGMDIALCSIDRERLQLQYAGAFNPLYLVRDHELQEIKADKFAIGSYFDGSTSFVNHTMELKKGDSIYLFSDGYADQFGGEANKKFKLNRFKSLLVGISDMEPEKQKEILKKTLDDWRGKLEQVDDILVIGMKL